ncbi:MAG: hypothetical protein ACXV2I_15095 [Actinomycetes bacterium]
MERDAATRVVQLVATAQPGRDRDVIGYLDPQPAGEVGHGQLDLALGVPQRVRDDLGDQQDDGVLKVVEVPLGRALRR